jgi:hypothetical protein
LIGFTSPPQWPDSPVHTTLIGFASLSFYHWSLVRIVLIPILNWSDPPFNTYKICLSQLGANPLSIKAACSNSPLLINHSSRSFGGRCQVCQKQWTWTRYCRSQVVWYDADSVIMTWQIGGEFWTKKWNVQGHCAHLRLHESETHYVVDLDRLKVISSGSVC